MEDFYNNMSLFQLLLKWKKHLIIITAVAALAGVIFSGPAFITPKYKSDAVLYPSNIAPYSEESETEQMLQIMQSGDIRDNVIAKFDLGKHYGLNPDDPHYMSYLINEFNERVKITKTQYESVQIVAMDQDPQMACDIIDAMIEFYNAKIKELHEEKFAEVVVMFQDALDFKKKTLDSLRNRQQEINQKYGLNNFELDANEIMRGYLGTSEGPASQINKKAVKELRENMGSIGAELKILERLIEGEALNYSDVKKEYDIAVMNFNRKYTYANIITEPFPADKKSYPVRWLVVVLAVAGSLFFEILVISIIEASKKK